MKIGIKLVVVLLFLCATGYLWAASKESGCVTCHTSETVMKSLFKPPMDSGGGEGEG